MKFLYILDCKGIQPVIRAKEFSKRLAKRNIFPVILTQNIQDKNHFQEIFNNDSSFEIIKTLFFEIKNKYIHFIMNFFLNLNFYFGWIPFAYFKAKKIIRKEKEIKFIYASGPEFYTHIIGYFLKKKFNLPLIVEYRDPWKGHLLSINKDTYLDKKIDLTLEKRILKCADIIITISEELSLFLKKKFIFVKSKPIISIPNGLEFLLFDKKITKNKIDKIELIFTGSLYGKRNIKPFLKIISKLKSDNYLNYDIFRFEIYGKYDKNNLISLIDFLNINDLVFLGGFISRRDLLLKVKRSTSPIHIGENLNYPTIAFKVWDYLSCGKKILYIGRKDSYTAKFLEENDFGTVIPINDLFLGVKAFSDLIDKIKLNKFNTEIDSRKLSDHHWDKRVEKFCRSIRNLLV